MVTQIIHENNYYKKKYYKILTFQPYVVRLFANEWEEKTKNYVDSYDLINRTHLGRKAIKSLNKW